jgi:hypothetical protein
MMRVVLALASVFVVRATRRRQRASSGHALPCALFLSVPRTQPRQILWLDLPYLEPDHRREAAFTVEYRRPIGTLRRLTGSRHAGAPSSRKSRRERSTATRGAPAVVCQRPTSRRHVLSY